MHQQSTPNELIFHPTIVGTQQTSFELTFEESSYVRGNVNKKKQYIYRHYPN